MGVRGLWARVLVGAVVAAPLAGVAMAASAGAAGGVTSLSYVSHPGDYIGQGASGTLDDPFQFQISGNAGRLTVSVDTGSESWAVSLTAPVGQQLSTGTYEGAARTEPALPGIDVSANGRVCSTAVGRFTIFALTSDSSGDITSLDAMLTQRCDDSTGELDATVKYDAPGAGPYFLSSSASTSVTDQPVTFTARANPGNGVVFAEGSTTLGVAFADAAGLARFTTSALSSGTHLVTARQGSSTSDPVAQVVGAGGTSMWFASQRGDWIGQGATASYAPPGATLRLNGTAAEAYVTVDDPVRNLSWIVDVAAPPGDTLHVGSYAGATKTSSRAPGEPGLDVFGNVRACVSVTGGFTVNDLEIGPDGRATRLDVTFTQHCDGGAAALTGRVRVNAAVTDSRGATTTTLSGGTTSDGAIGLTAKVTGGGSAPTGVMTFLEGATVLGTSDVNGGTAFFIAAGLPLGSHTITAEYGGDPGYLPSSGSATFVLALLPTTTSISVPKTAKAGKPMSVSVTVTSAPGSPGAGGQVRLYDGSAAVGAATTLTAGTATITWTPPAKGQHSLTVRYLGDPTHAESVSDPKVVKVN